MKRERFLRWGSRKPTAAAFEWEVPSFIHFASSDPLWIAIAWISKKRCHNRRWSRKEKRRGQDVFLSYRMRMRFKLQSKRTRCRHEPDSNQRFPRIFTFLTEFLKRKKRRERTGSWGLLAYQAILAFRSSSSILILYFLLKKLLTIKMKDDRLSTQEDRESHIREKVTNRVEPSNIAKA